MLHGDARGQRVGIIDRHHRHVDASAFSAARSSSADAGPSTDPDWAIPESLRPESPRETRATLSIGPSFASSRI